MRSIKNTLKLYLLDWKRIFKNPIATILIIAIMIIPSLYAWFNIKALWDPYGNTGELPIAVYSADKPAEFQGKEIAIGKEVIKSLHDNKQLGWQFVDSKKELEDGVRSGEYYAGIYLPEDFSEDLLSFTTGDINKPKIEYTVNEKINAIAPKITDKGATAIQTQISDEFIKTASSTLLKVFNEIGYDIDSNLVSINKVKSMILSTDENLDTIDGYTQQVLDLQKQLPDIKEKLNKANEFIDYLPKVDEMGQKVVELNGKMPQLQEQTKIILDLQQKIPEIQNAGKQLAEIDGDFSSIQETMNQGINEAKQGLTIIQQVQDILPDVKNLEGQANNLASQTKTGANQLKDALPGITTSVKTTLDSIGQVATTTSSLASTINQAISDNQLTDDEKQKIGEVLTNFANSIPEQQNAIDQLVSFLTKLQENAGNTKLQNIIDALNNAKPVLSILQERVTALNQAIQSGNIDDVKTLLGQVQDAAKNVNSLVSVIDPAQASSTVESILNQVISTIETAQGALSKADQIDFDSLLSSTKATVTNAVAILEKYQKEMPAIGQEIHDANTMLNGNMAAIVDGINKGADLYNNDLPVLANKLNLAADFIQNDWPTVKNEITGTMSTVNEKMPQVETAVNAAADLITNDWPSIKAGIQKAADAIRKGEQEVDLGEVIKLLKLDATKESDFFTSPVELKTNALYPIANNGSASTPFYTALCLWVGAVLLSSVATTDYYLGKKDRNNFTKREQFVARMLTFLTMAVAQSLIVTLGNIFLLGVDVQNPVYSVLFAVLIGLAFMMIVYVLAALFDNVGKGLAIIILVLSISGGGGNYPIQVSGKFFQMINPFLPFTHAVNLLRESAGGIYWPNAIPAIWIMIALFIVFGIVGTAVAPYVQEKMLKFKEAAHKSHIFH
ncbi:YhgE/Pip domain-containing protein [Enterococcus durans]|uniref:YhgE/Pip domain-containing protein n=1 Tax=Enterococcus durans TaxID=53345 RepID=A0A5N0YYX8_9ENTE|nr:MULTISPECIES: YhgE/Pip domain-containing protein [Enterococcus]KAA9179684.1 YhgE/Pip domain-containing protein [Enterococcus durans]KAA9185002.1 YhgE/Pip domain-containing protein [Enterococcus durans]KAA9185926.1 YhgE/Pip domain-containing protein [Enterococcus durans]KAA9190345.1 YhgE/Pip domain-containing protein [Enterococcus durans]KAA9194486.1 YhgE/Pip domain-containing protein [Enterococcus durans]